MGSAGHHTGASTRPGHGNGGVKGVEGPRDRQCTHCTRCMRFNSPVDVVGPGEAIAGEHLINVGRRTGEGVGGQVPPRVTYFVVVQVQGRPTPPEDGVRARSDVERHNQQTATTKTGQGFEARQTRARTGAGRPRGPGGRSPRQCYHRSCVLRNIRLGLRGCGGQGGCRHRWW